jgi:Ca-activated chloride channel family protein
MTFENPLLLASLLLIPAALVLYLLVQRRRTRYAVRFTNVDLLANLVPKAPRWRRHVPPLLYLVAIAALGMALARPSMTLAVPREEATVILTMDVSRSMLATDVEPSRMVAAKQAAADFVAQLPERFQVGLVAFSGEARLVVPPTIDRAQLLRSIDNLTANGGTALGDAIGLSLDAAESVRAGAASAAPEPSASPDPVAGADPTADPSAVPDATATPDTAKPDEPPLVATVLLSDGANSTGTLEPIDAAERAADDGVPIYTIALGTQDGVVTVPDQLGNPRQLNVPPDTETLAEIAEITGARFFQAPTADDLAAIYASLGSRVGFTLEEQEVTQWFAAGALVLVLLGGGLAALWFNRFP